MARPYIQNVNFLSCDHYSKYIPPTKRKGGKLEKTVIIGRPYNRRGQGEERLMNALLFFKGGATHS